MKVWELKDDFGLDNLEQGERPEPQPGPGQVLIEMRVAALNYRDLVAVEGGDGRTVTTPLVAGSDGVGTVAAVGDGVTRVKVGERVAPTFLQGWISGDATAENLGPTMLGGPLDGTLSEFMLVGEQGVVTAPDYLADEEVACLPCAALTAWSALVTQGCVGPHSSVLVQGTGGVALFALQFAKMLGAEVIVISSSDEKLERARAMGADHTINYRANPDWHKAAQEITGGKGHVLELGGSETLARSLKAVRTGGHISLIGVLSGPEAELNLPLVVTRNVRLQGITVGSREGFETMLRAMTRHGTRPIVDTVFPFDEAPAAFRHLKSGGHFGKVCIRVRD